MRTNIILETDSYKLSHWAMYPPELEYLTSYFEARVGGEFQSTIFFGLQYLLEEYLSGVVVTQDDILEAYNFAGNHFGNTDVFNLKGWQYIVDTYEGRLPIKIRAVAEGAIVPEGNALFTVENTDPNVPWLVNHIETMLVRLWYPCTVATSSYNLINIIKEPLERSSDSIYKLPFMLHDFGSRGSTSLESASIGGAAHLLSFVGTDNIDAIRFVQKYYGDSKNMCGYSVPAAEHSTITSWGKEGESQAYEHILNTFPSGFVSVVSDSWNIYDACEKIWGEELKSLVESKDRVLVVRPDSGNPETVVPDCLNILGNKFGCTINSKGYKVLPPYIRMIQGDGISRRSLPNIIEAILRSGWSLENLVFGSGGGLLQDFNRDTCRFAMKCSAVKMKGDTRWREVFKNPSSDPTKNSKKGYLYLSPSFTTTSSVVSNNLLEIVFEDGKIMIWRSWLDLLSRIT